MNKLVSVIMTLFLLSFNVLAAGSVTVDVEEWEENNSYPDWYGGRYIDDSGKLVLVIVEGYEDILPEDFGEKYSYVIKKYSFNQLKKVQEEIGEQWMATNSDGEICVIAAALNEFDNRVDVTLNSGSSKIEEVRGQLYQKYGDMISIEVSDYPLLISQPPERFDWLPIAALGIAMVVLAVAFFLYHRRIFNREER